MLHHDLLCTGNEKVFTKNPAYWDQDCFLFDTVTIRMVESTDIAFQLYQTGEVDYTDLSECNLVTISGNENNDFYDYLVERPADKYSYQIHFNYNKLLEDGTPDTNWNTAIANEAFRNDPSITAGISPNTTPASMPLPQWSARTTSTP